MSKIQLNESLFEAVNSIGRVRPDTYKKRQKPISVLVFDSLETLGYNVYANSKGNGYEISKKYEKNLQKAKDLCDALNLDYTVRPFRDRFYMTINLPKEDENTINKYFRSTDRVMAEKVTTKKGSNKLNKYLKEDDNTLSIEDKFNYLKSYPTYSSRSGSGKAYTRHCKVYDLGLTDEQREEFFKFLEDGGLETFWSAHEYDSLNIYQEGRMGGHLILDPQVVDPLVFDEFNSYEEYLQDYLDSNYYPDLETPEGDLEYSSEQIENATSEVNSEISGAYDALVDFDNRVDALIRDLKGTLDLRINDSDIDNLNESIDEVKNILQPLVTKDNKVRALKDSEKLPRGFRFKSGTDTSGEVSYKGTDYAYAIVNGKLKVMTSTDAGDNWSETIYKESIENVYQMFLKTIEEYADEHDLDLDNLTKHNDIIPEAGDYYRAAVEDLISLGKEWKGYFGKISHTVLDDIKEMVKEKLGIGEILKKLKDDATKYLTESFKVVNKNGKNASNSETIYKEDLDHEYKVFTIKLKDDNGNIYTEEEKIPAYVLSANPNLDLKEYLKDYYYDEILEVTPSGYVKTESLDNIQTAVDKIFSSGDKGYPYAMLDRMKSDCEYYLGYGNRSSKYLWGKDPKQHIEIMKAIYNRLDPKPEWLTIDKINEYEKNMLEEPLEYDSTVKNESFEDEHLGEVSKKEFTVTAVDKNGSTYLGRVKAKDNKEAENKFLTYKDNKDLQIAGSHETTPDEIRKGVRLIEDMEMVPETPTVGPELGIAGVINSLIIDEFEAIDGYNSAIATAEQEGMTDIINVLKDIANEENLHVGQLQTCLAKVSPNAQSIDNGQVEAQQQLDDVNQTQENKI